MNLRRALALAVFSLPSLALVHCERDALIGRDLPAPPEKDAGNGGRNSGGASNTGGAASGGAQSETGAPKPCVPVSCQNKIYACGNCKNDDPDQDDLIDADDPDCLGPCQESEDSFASPSHGNGPPCELDCYFDGNAGSGDDDCGWTHHCDPLPAEGPSCEFDENAKVPRAGTCDAARTSQSTKCMDSCLPLVPNGCDCFGCCAIPGLDHTIWIGSASDDGLPCDLAHADDPSRCRPCTQVPSCLNECDTCELCVGKTELPASCNPGAECPTPVCARNNPCGSPCLPSCPEGQACITGCCAEIPR